MREKITPLLGLVLLGIFGGFAAGAVLGYVVMPINYLGTDISNMRAAEKDDWVIMVSAAYALDDNLTDARQRIDRIDENPVVAATYVADVAQRTIDQNDTRNARNVSALAIALGVATTPIRNYAAKSATPLPTPR